MIGDWVEIPLEQVAKLDYRGGPYPGMFTVTARDGEVISVPPRACRNTYLAHAHDRCLVCYDYANEAADVSIGDYFGLEMKRGMPGWSMCRENRARAARRWPRRSSLSARRS